MLTLRLAYDLRHQIARLLFDFSCLIVSDFQNDILSIVIDILALLRVVVDYWPTEPYQFMLRTYNIFIKIITRNFMLIIGSVRIIRRRVKG